MSRWMAAGFGGVLFAAMLLAAPPQAHAVLVTLQLTIDELTKGRAVLSGDLDDTAFALGPGFFEASPEVTGTNWFVKARLFKDPTAQEGVFQYGLSVLARHISNPAPHAGEATPGLLLGGPLKIFHHNLNGLSFPLTTLDPEPQDNSHTLIHPGAEDHFDVLASHVDDLNGATRGFLTADNQISARFDLAHTPEPSSFFLLGSGLLGLAGRRRRKFCLGGTGF